MATVRKDIQILAEEVKRLTYLTVSNPVELAPNIVLMGHDSWADGCFGDFLNSPVMLNDYFKIAELQFLEPDVRLEQMQYQAELGKICIEKQLLSVIEDYTEILLLTHVPPFEEACWHEGHVSGKDWLPHFSCKTMGNMLTRIMNDHPERQLTVFCGHTHSGGICKILPNLTIYTGEAEYEKPQVQLPIFF